MLDLAKDIHPLTDFKRKTPEFVRRMKKTGQPVVLTVNGKAALVVQDAAAYQRLLAVLDRAAAIEGIHRGLEEVKQGKTRPIEEALEGLRRKYEV
jgi:prevent-host-death family protein